MTQEPMQTGHDLNGLAAEMRAISKANGFDNPASIDEVELTATKLLLINEEVLEAWREVRKTGDVEAFREELADILIRTLDLTVDMGIDIDDAVARKTERNRSRPHKHGAKV